MAALAEKRFVDSKIVKRQSSRRIKESVLSRLSRHPMVCVLLLAAAACIIASAYVSAYASSAEKGWSRTALVKELAETRLENESLRVDIERMKHPEDIEAYASKIGMKPCMLAEFLEPSVQPQLAQNSIRGELE